MPSFASRTCSCSFMLHLLYRLSIRLPHRHPLSNTAHAPALEKIVPQVAARSAALAASRREVSRFGGVDMDPYHIFTCCSRNCSNKSVLRSQVNSLIFSFPAFASRIRKSSSSNTQSKFLAICLPQKHGLEMGKISFGQFQGLYTIVSTLPFRTRVYHKK